MDWLTVTCKDPEKRSRFEEIAVGLLHAESELGEKMKPTRLMGFEGLACGGVGFGKMIDMDLMRLSGPVAWANWSRVFDQATNCSRIDLQVTVSVGEWVDDLIMDHHREALVHVAQWKRKPEVLLRDSNVKPPTLYLNTRQSERFGRCYNKGVESKLAHYAGCARYEVQFNEEAALLMALTLQKASPDPAQAIPRVYKFFRAKGLGLGWLSEDLRKIGRAPQRQSTALQRLRWLSNQVRGPVQELIAQGLEAEVHSALGLSEPK